MPADPLDIFTKLAGARENAVVESAFQADRRQRTRTRVRWRVLFEHGGTDAIETVTENLSSGGFYCFCCKAFTPGEPVLCLLLVPAQDPNDEDRTLALECRGKVMRAEAVAHGLFGIACCIDDYRMIPRFIGRNTTDSDGARLASGQASERIIKGQMK